jgi:lysine 2,3-aminomutase
MQALLDGEWIDASEAPEIEKVLQRFSMAITPQVAGIMANSDLDGGVARQYVPTRFENDTAPGELEDPIGDLAHSPLKGIIHRHSDRVLLNLLQNCAVYCRFCFRRENIGPNIKALSADETKQALAYIASHEEVWEVILSGGDPLLLQPSRVADIAASLNRIDHVGVMRVHTRIPVADPGRISDAMIAALRIMQPTYVVVHVNHSSELNDDARLVLARMADAGIPLLSQSVLLKGINDDAGTLTRLFRNLVECRVKPYYLHHPDKARGTAHFRTSIATGQKIMRELRGDVSGLCQPTYVLDIPGGHGKVPIGPNYLETCCTSASDYVLTDVQGLTHQYADDGS